MHGKLDYALSKSRAFSLYDQPVAAYAVEQASPKLYASARGLRWSFPVGADQLDLQALHRVRSRLVGQRTAVINQIRSFLLERGIAVRQGPRYLRQQLPEISAKRIDVLSARMIGIIEDSGDWRRPEASLPYLALYEYTP